MLISAFCDESGKFKDQNTVSFSAMAGTQNDVSGLHDEWQRHLRLNGLKVLTMKKALNSAKPLSDKRAALGIGNRLDALMPFAECIRRHLQNIVAIAVDVKAYRNASSALHKRWTNDPHIMAFTRVLMEMLRPLNKRDCINIICDDEESTALPMYQLYRRIKLIYPDARKSLVSLSFADDEVFSQLQAADFLASLARLEARKYFHEEGYEYNPLWDALRNPKKEDKIWNFGSCFIGEKELIRQAQEEARIGKQRSERKQLSD